MYDNNITLDTSVYALVQETSTKSIRKDASKPLDNPVSLSIAHEKANNGKISSVIIFDDDKVVVGTDNVLSSLARCQFKITYNPNEGRDDLSTAINKGIAVLQAFLTDTGNVTKFLNQEH